MVLLEHLEQKNSNKSIKLLELFGGIGAPRKALENLGYKIESAYVEKGRSAVKSYNAIFDEQNSMEDVICFSGKGLDVDILFHGSPCQDFSEAGLMKGGTKGSGTRSSLMWETVRIVEECKPRLVIWENVKSVTDSVHIMTFGKYLDELEALGYNNSHRVLNSRDFGVPQNRERIFVVSVLDSCSKECQRLFDFDELEEQPIKDLKEYVDFDTDESYPDLFTRLCEELGEFVGVKPKTTKVGYFGKDYLDRRVYMLKDYVPTIVTHNCPLFTDSRNIRRLTALESWLLMGFDEEDFVKAEAVVSERQLYKQAGNTIVVDVLEELFRGLERQGFI